MRRLDTMENRSDNLERNRLGRLYNIHCFDKSSNEVLCKQRVIEYRSSELKMIDEDLDSTLADLKDPLKKSYVRDFLWKYRKIETDTVSTVLQNL